MNQMRYISRIKANISLYSTKRTSNILDGLYRSIYQGKSLDFDELREYNVGDSIKDIDWKASARSSKLLVRRYVAEKKHNVMVILDSGKKMFADTKNGEKKSDVAAMTGGTLAFVANLNENYVSFAYKTNELTKINPFKLGLGNIEYTLNDYVVNMDTSQQESLNGILSNIISHVKRKMIIFLVTDLSGLDELDENLLKKVTINNDIFSITISDAEFTNNNLYDIENENYISRFFANNEKIIEMEKKIKTEVLNRCSEKLKKCQIPNVIVDSNSQITNQIIMLLKEKSYASKR